MKRKHQYPPEWNDTIRPAILKRDNYTCTEPGCKVRHRSVGYYDAAGNWHECDQFMKVWALNQGIKVKPVYLQVAHINHNKSDNREENLRSMCPRHHLNNDRVHSNLKRKMRGRQSK